MGLGLELAAALPRKGWLNRTAEPERILSDVAASAGRFARETGDPIARWYWDWTSATRLFLNLCPFEENVELTVTSDRVVCSAKTSGAGPGYHRYVVELLDHLEQECGLGWTEGEDGGDETGFFRDRDESELQRAMCGQLSALAGALLEASEEGSTGFKLNFPLDFAPRRDAFAISSLGKWPRSWFEDVAASDAQELLRLAGEYYPWWDSGLTAANLRKLGLASCWMDVPWVSPVNERETRACETALACFERARSLDPGIGLPDWEIGEIQRVLRGADEDASPPAETGIGFRRTTVALPLTGGWTVELPGYFHSEYQTDDDAQLYFFGDRSLRGSSWSFDTKATPEETLESLTDAREGRELALGADHLSGRYTTEWSDEEEVFVLSASVAKTDGLCFVTITHAEADDEAWAIRAASTVLGPKPR